MLVTFSAQVIGKLVLCLSVNLSATRSTAELREVRLACFVWYVSTKQRKLSTIPLDHILLKLSWPFSSDISSLAYRISLFSAFVRFTVFLVSDLENHRIPRRN